MSFMQQSVPPAPPPNLIPKVSENKPVQIANLPRKPVVKSVSMPPPSTPAPQMKPPNTSNIDDLLKEIKQTVLPPQGNGPPPPEKVGKSAMKSKPGSTGKNSVVIKL
jgi:hypothetical protein